ncbi:peptide methionine sulfoxide reductase MsrA [Halalkalibacter akibai JCM 9157]|uniref:peptide-methionine (S)-S-oxide reductase n=1 Tax=Halalkalibacter akibai (strain ATCC 43226 / DSM 21942 / CIP 109018 / JCM 9157 / 1139) TaxID=1236973 RepID=W4QYE7_HALA3|nr:peptide methionine sulfoxide reductase MsrA [Halalkalibacter akibai JCM 9157]
MGDHTETIEIDFDPDVIQVSELLTIFWGNHNSLRKEVYRGRQYLSLFLYRTEAQRKMALQLKENLEDKLNGVIQTEVSPFTHFYVAEDKHQKYYLKRFPKAYEDLLHLFESHQQFVNSTLVARLNGFVREFGTLQTIRTELEHWKLDEREYQVILKIINGLKW